MPASASSKTNLADVLVTSATRLRYYETAVQLSFDARKPRVVESPSRRTCNQLIRFRSHRGCLNKSVAAYNAVEFCPRVCLSVTCTASRRQNRGQRTMEGGYIRPIRKFGWLDHGAVGRSNDSVTCETEMIGSLKCCQSCSAVCLVL